MLALPIADLIPVRALNQVTYCNRLYFLQYVDVFVLHGFIAVAALKHLNECQKECR